MLYMRTSWIRARTTTDSVRTSELTSTEYQFCVRPLNTQYWSVQLKEVLSLRALTVTPKSIWSSQGFQSKRASSVELLGAMIKLVMNFSASVISSSITRKKFFPEWIEEAFKVKLLFTYWSIIPSNIGNQTINQATIIVFLKSLAERWMLWVILA